MVKVKGFRQYKMELTLNYRLFGHRDVEIFFLADILPPVHVTKLERILPFDRR